MMRKLLAGFAIASLLLCVVVLLFWWRSNHGHSDHLGFPGFGHRRAELVSLPGSIWVTSTHNAGEMVVQTSKFYRFKDVAAGCLILPALWLSLWIRAKLPRPGRMPRRLGAAEPIARHNGDGSGRSPGGLGRNGTG